MTGYIFARVVGRITLMSDLVLSKKINFDTNVTTSGGSLSKKEFKVDPATLGLLMDLLIKQYSNPVEGSFREILSNAVDATVESGSEQPVEITLPTELDPFLVITDYGVGMSEDDLDSTYVNYGKSTKVDDLKQIGAKGIGSKSPLAMSASFIVSTTRDGRTITASVEHSIQGGCMEIMSDTLTNLPNGTSIRIPYTMDQIDTLNKYLARMRWMFPVPIMVDGKDINMKLPKETISFATKDFEYFIIPSNKSWYSSGRVQYVVGGILYDAPSSYDKSIVENFNVIIKLPNGSVTFPASRDQIELSPHSTKTLTKSLEPLQYTDILKDNILRMSAEIDSKDNISKLFSTHILPLVYMLKSHTSDVKKEWKRLTTLFDESYPNISFEIFGLKTGYESNGYLPVKNGVSKEYQGHILTNIAKLYSNNELEYFPEDIIIVDDNYSVSDIKKAYYSDCASKIFIKTTSEFKEVLKPLFKKYKEFDASRIEEETKRYKERLALYRGSSAESPTTNALEDNYFIVNVEGTELKDGKPYYYFMADSSKDYDDKKLYGLNSVSSKRYMLDSFKKMYTLLYIRNKATLNKLRKKYPKSEFKVLTYIESSKWEAKELQSKKKKEALALYYGFKNTQWVKAPFCNYVYRNYFSLDTKGLNLGPLRDIVTKMEKINKTFNIENEDDFYELGNIYSNNSLRGMKIVEHVKSSCNHVYSCYEEDLDVVIYLAKTRGLKVTWPTYGE